MTHAPSWATAESLSWLQKILRDRFGLSFALEIIEGTYVRLRLPHAESYVDIEINPIFATLGRRLSCIWWTPETEGWQSTLGLRLPATGAVELPSPLIEIIGNGVVRIRYDILGLVYWFLNRLEEIGVADLDEHSRFSAKQSSAFADGYLERPVVDEWLEILAQVFRRIWPGVQLVARSFRTKISHDVDFPSMYAFKSPRALIRQVAGQTWRTRNYLNLIQGPWVRFNSRKTLHPADPYNNFDWIMDVVEKNNLKSAFYFISGQTNKKFDGDYDINHAAIRDLMRKIHARGHEIGLHPSYESYRSPAIIAKEANALKRVAAEEGIHQEVWGGRMHFLRWSHPTTLVAWAEAGMSYDSTLGYADAPGFRCGTCFEYVAFDPIKQKALDLKIRPLVVMEGTVIGSHYMGLGVSEAAYKKIVTLKRICEKVSGVFTLLWHNSQLIRPDSRKLFQTIVQA